MNVIPAEAGIQERLKILDSFFLNLSGTGFTGMTNFVPFIG